MVGRGGAGEIRVRRKGIGRDEAKEWKTGDREGRSMWVGMGGTEGGGGIGRQGKG